MRALLVDAVLGPHVLPGSDLHSCHACPGVALQQCLHRLVIGLLALVDLRLSCRCITQENVSVTGDATGLVERSAGWGVVVGAIVVLKLLGVSGVLAVELRSTEIRRAVVQRAEELAHKPALIRFGVVVPGAAQNDELDLVGNVSHLLQCVQAALHL